MHSYEVLEGMLTQSLLQKLPLLILAEMKHHICGRHAVLKGVVQFLVREKLNPYILKLPLFQRDILDV